MPKPVYARDGLRARDSGRWARDKLEFLDLFCPSALQAAARKRQRYFIDLFAGSGVNVERDSGGHEFPGSPLRALEYTAPGDETITFTHAVFVNNRPADHAALESRLQQRLEIGQSRIPQHNIKNLIADTNTVIHEIVRDIPLLAYAFVFADIEAPKQLPWRTVSALRSLDHSSIDLYVLFPLDMAVQRLMSYRQERRERYADRMTEFFGTTKWRDLAMERPTSSQSGDLRRALMELYLAQLGTLWSHTGVIMDVFLRGRQRLYKMLFATEHSAAARIADWIRTRTLREQGELF